MNLQVKHPSYVMPSYSLTGDLLAYLNCGLQYRYHNRGSLPPSTPVQLWFGEFVHGVLEEAYLHWKETGTPFPWTWVDTVQEIEQSVDRYRLRPKGLLPPPNLYDPTGQVQLLASKRTVAAINTWGPHLFPLIEWPEVKLKGIRPLAPPGLKSRADYYEIQGIADVLGQVNIDKADPGNELVKSLRAVLGPLDRFGPEYEVLVDYKGMRRPGLSDPAWRRFEWQVRTYSWLRLAQPDSKPNAAGVLLFLNELVPSAEDVERLIEETPIAGRAGTDVLPEGRDIAELRAWSARTPARPAAERYPVIDLTESFRRRRSIRVIDVSESSMQSSLAEFDKVVWQIEEAVASEIAGHPISQGWQAVFLNKSHGNKAPDQRVCTACDFKSYCPMSSQPGNPSAP